MYQTYHCYLFAYFGYILGIFTSLKHPSVILYIYIFFGLLNGINKDIISHNFTHFDFLLLFIDNKLFAAYAGSCLFL